MIVPTVLLVINAVVCVCAGTMIVRLGFQLRRDASFAESISSRKVRVLATIVSIGAALFILCDVWFGVTIATIGSGESARGALLRLGAGVIFLSWLFHYVRAALDPDYFAAAVERHGRERVGNYLLWSIGILFAFGLISAMEGSVLWIRLWLLR